jgi:hypothetical protein
MNTETINRNTEASGLLNSVVVRLTSAHKLASTGITDPDVAADVFEAIQAIIEGAIRKLDACEKAIGGPGTGTIG